MVSVVKTRSGRVSKVPQRLELFEEVEDDYISGAFSLERQSSVDGPEIIEETTNNNVNVAIVRDMDGSKREVLVPNRNKLIKAPRSTRRQVSKRGGRVGWGEGGVGGWSGAIIEKGAEDGRVSECTCSAMRDGGGSMCGAHGGASDVMHGRARQVRIPQQADAAAGDQDHAQHRDAEHPRSRRGA